MLIESTDIIHMGIIQSQACICIVSITLEAP